jgi:cell division protease FtsH
MSRFFKSAAFPILIVVVLAFFAQKLIGSSNQTRNYTYGNLIQQLQINDKDNTADVTLNRSLGNAKYSVGFPTGEPSSLINQLANQDIKNGTLPAENFNVEGTGSSGWLSLLTYILPFIIFIGFWIFLMNQV